MCQLLKTELGGSSLSSVDELFVPRHLNGFELALVGLFRIVLELRQCGNVAMQFRET